MPSYEPAYTCRQAEHDDFEYDNRVLVIPDQSMSVKEMLSRHVRGLRIPDAVAGGTYDDEKPDVLGLEGRNWNKLDMAEQHDLVARAARELRNTANKWVNQETAKFQKQLKDQAVRQYQEQNPIQTPNVTQNKKE